MALTIRVEALESVAQARLAASGEELAAQRIAEELGFEVKLIGLPASRAGNPGKRKLARELAARGWSAARIARVLRVCERTAERWVVGTTRRGKVEG